MKLLREILSFVSSVLVEIWFWLEDEKAILKVPVLPSVLCTNKGFLGGIGAQKKFDPELSHKIIVTQNHLG